jgi:hypothetical protein
MRFVRWSMLTALGERGSPTSNALTLRRVKHARKH